jgi:hypothetical protein
MHERTEAPQDYPAVTRHPQESWAGMRDILVAGLA